MLVSFSGGASKDVAVLGLYTTACEGRSTHEGNASKLNRAAHGASSLPDSAPGGSVQSGPLKVLVGPGQNFPTLSRLASNTDSDGVFGPLRTRCIRLNANRQS
ncbi:hypothetical protein GWK47_041549 [Chionoecetes opilio]|uniref:Uncharacterized protein n=1 Tax=Chionoecetes opilio TaxID=41210 RepID=A0A8J4YNW5_CHIOP|nr:hypothetical protein GWK47_041549 [Chionoecetes opilio]